MQSNADQRRCMLNNSAMHDSQDVTESNQNQDDGFTEQTMPHAPAPSLDMHPVSAASSAPPKHTFFPVQKAEDVVKQHM